mgnify:CR=1 FL=1
MKQKALKAAFPYTLPIFAGFWFLALAYGILMNVNGFPFVYPMFEPASLRDGRPAGSFLILFQFFSVLIRVLFQSLVELPDEVAKGRHLISAVQGYLLAAQKIRRRACIRPVKVRVIRFVLGI